MLSVSARKATAAISSADTNDTFPLPVAVMILSSSLIVRRCSISEKFSVASHVSTTVYQDILENEPINQLGLNTAHSIPGKVDIYPETLDIIGPSPTSSKLALSNTKRFTPCSTDRSMNDFMGGKQSIIGGATRKIAAIEVAESVKGLSYVETSNQSNFTPVVLARAGDFPEREAIRVWFP